MPIEVRKILTAPSRLKRSIVTGKLTSKSRTTIPQPVRVALGIGLGDEVSYEIEEHRVVLRKAWSEPSDDPSTTFSEWRGEADWEAHADRIGALSVTLRDEVWPKMRSHLGSS